MSQHTDTIHPFDQAIELGGEPGRRTANVSSAYQNMVGPFGGVTTAKILNSVLQHPESEGSPVSLTINFLGPIVDDEIEIRPFIVRTNRSNQHWMVELQQGDDIQCTATLILAKRNMDTWESEEIRFPKVPGFEDVAPLPQLPLPPWLKQYDMRFISGSPFGQPADGQQNTIGQESAHSNNLSESLVWISDIPSRKIDFLSLAALCDAFFPRLFVRKKKMAPIGTVTLTIHFHANAEALHNLTSGVVLGHARASKFSGSYFDQTAEIWSSDKVLLATTSQLVYYKD